MTKDYNGFTPDRPVNSPGLRALPRPPRFDHGDAFEATQRQMRRENETPVRRLTDDILEQTLKARVYVMDHLISNPGIVATFDDFEYIFDDDIQLETDSESLRSLNETKIIITHTVRIRKKDRNEDDRTSLGGDFRGEARTD